MRKFFKGFFTFLVIIILIIILAAVGLIVFRNQIATYVIEKAGSAAAGARVEVENVYLPPLKLHITWDRLQFTDRRDTWKNLFETGKCEFSLAFKPLLDRKVLIEKMQLEELRFDTRRSTDGKLPAKPLQERKPSRLMTELKKNLEREKQQIPVFNPKQLKTTLNVDSLLAMFDFITPALADSVISLAEERYAYWNNLISTNDYEQRIQKIENDIKNIQLEGMDTLPEFESNLTLALNTYQNTKTLYDDISREKTQIEQDLTRLVQLKKDVPAWIKHDYDNAVALAKLPDVTLQKVAVMLFGDRVTSGLLMILEQIEKSRQMARADLEKPARKEKLPHLPSLWIREISLSAYGKDDLVLTGKAFDITTDQKRTEKPMKIALSGKQAQIGRIDLGAILDYRTENNRETINLNIEEFPVKSLKLANFDLLPTRLNQGNAFLNTGLNLSDEIIVATVDFSIQNVQFDYTSQPEMNADLVRISRSISESIREIILNARIEQQTDKFTFKLNSNLDNIIAAQLKQVVKDEVARGKALIQERVMQELTPYRTRLEELVSSKNAELQARIEQLNSRINLELQKIENKKQEIQDRLKAEQDKLKQQALDQLDDKLNDSINELLKKFQ
ncbi:MAG: TIGR03545 family protein [Candidatus Cloacimonetes bacterium]|nr:TIGR03545 family protein [Candidatus Cloacimonadota bacterium]